MAYIIPSVQVYQVLENSGGVANSTPDLDACVIGPCYNVVRYVSGDATALSATFVNRTLDFSSDVAVAMPSATVGQAVEDSSMEVYLNNADIVSFSSTSVTAVAAGTTLTLGSGSFTSTSQAGVVVTRPGDSVRITYTATGAPGVNVIMDSKVRTVSSSQITIADMLPANLATVTKVQIIQTWNDVLVPAAHISTINLVTNGTIAVKSTVTTAYGTPLAANIHVSYRALRADLSGTINTMADLNAIKSALQNVGDITDENPLALAAKIALANTTTSVKAIAVASDDLDGYQQALNLSEGDRLYSMVPLSQDNAVLALFKTHVDQMSTPEMHNWRVTYVSPKIPTSLFLGQGSDLSPLTNGSVTQINGYSVLTYAGGSFIGDGVVPGDKVTVTAATPVGAVGTFVVKNVLNNQQLELADTVVNATSVGFYVHRTLTRTARAQQVAKMAKSANNKRYILSIPEVCGVSINGTVKYLPGYYLCAGLAGMTAGFPPQQGFTNVGVAGISDLKQSNFYYTRSDLNLMAEAGVLIWAQATQGGQPYCRHELTTDISTLEYRELMKVKNWDYLSYYYYDKLTPFIGSWNLVPETLNIIRQTITASSEALKGKKSPKIGAPLVSYQIAKLEQNKVNKDNLDIVLYVGMGDPNNYTNLYLTV